MSPKNRGSSSVVGSGGGAVTEARSLVNCETEDAMTRVRMIHVWKIRPVFDELRMMSVVAAMSVITSREENGCKRTDSLEDR